MRMRRSWAGLAGAWAIALGSAAFGQAGDEAIKDRVAQLVERLGSPKFAAQAAAEKSLVALGQRAVAFLPPADSIKDEKLRVKLDGIRKAIEENNASVNLGPSKVTLEGTGIRLSEAIKDLQDQSGNTISDLREANGEETTNPALDLAIRDLPFFEALDVVAEKAGVTINPFTGDGSIGLMAGPMMMPSASPDARPRPKPMIAYTGPFRVEMKQISTVRDFGTGNSGATAQMEILWEPRLRPMLLSVKNQDLSIVDDQGRKVEPQVKDGADETSLKAGNCSVELNLALAAPERSAAKLSSAKIKGVITVPAGLKNFRFRSLDAKRDKQSQGDIAVTLVSTEVDEQVWKVVLDLDFPGEGPAFASYRQGLFNNRLWLQRKDGSRFDQNGGFNTLGSDGGKMAFEYLFVDAPGKPGDYGLIYETPSKVVEIPVDFEFKEIPLP